MNTYKLFTMNNLAKTTLTLAFLSILGCGSTEKNTTEAPATPSTPEKTYEASGETSGMIYRPTDNDEKKSKESLQLGQVEVLGLNRASEKRGPNPDQIFVICSVVSSRSDAPTPCGSMNLILNYTGHDEDNQKQNLTLRGERNQISKLDPKQTYDLRFESRGTKARTYETVSTGTTLRIQLRADE